MFEVIHERQRSPEAGQLRAVLVSFHCVKAHFFKMIYKTNENPNVIIHSVYV